MNVGVRGYQSSFLFKRSCVIIWAPRPTTNTEIFRVFLFCTRKMPMQYLQFGYVTAFCSPPCYSLIIPALRGSNCRTLCNFNQVNFVKKKELKQNRSRRVRTQANTYRHTYNNVAPFFIFFIQNTIRFQLFNKFPALSESAGNKSILESTFYSDASVHFSASRVIFL